MSKFFNVFCLLVAVCLMNACTTIDAEEENVEVFCQWKGYKSVDARGVSTCSNVRWCSDEELLPNQPCELPMPKYYNNYPLTTGEMMLIHPYTRKIVVCKEDSSADIGINNCVNSFREKGFVLLTDIPQMPAKYDSIKEGTYPARRWRNNGEIVPRW